jgi:hypothetical protein
MRKNFKNWAGKMMMFKLVSFAIMGLVVLLLWNNIITSVIGWKTISYLQSLGLLLLTRILTGNIGPRGMYGPGGMMYRKGWMKERWKNMSEEQKNNGCMEREEPTGRKNGKIRWNKKSVKQK